VIPEIIILSERSERRFKQYSVSVEILELFAVKIGIYGDYKKLSEKFFYVF